ncbi:MAG: hypothetical protein M3020_18105 [Myxococcota bacterium]|nr:hypothetical protein [Myxococcota bacterium]
MNPGLRRAVLGALLLLLPRTIAAAPPGPGPQPLPPKEAAAPPEPKHEPDDWTRRVRVAGGIALYYYQPTNGWDNQFLVYSNLRFDAAYEGFGLHFEPRLSNEKMRPFYDGLAWIQEAYLYAGDDALRLKVGKIYKQVGLFWDNSFYGNIQVYEGLKFDPGAGFSLEAKLGEKLGVNAFAQFFVVDGHTNASLVGRDTISIPGARRRNTLAARLQPFAQLSRSARLELGFSGERFDAELPEATHSVQRLAVDAKLSWGALGFWGEVLHQSGANVNAHPLPGAASSDNTFLLAGVEYALAPLVFRYNLSLARYSELSVDEVLHLPAIGIRFEEHVSFLAEYALWHRYTPDGRSDVDESLNLTWLGHF